VCILHFFRDLSFKSSQRRLTCTSFRTYLKSATRTRPRNLNSRPDKTEIYLEVAYDRCCTLICSLLLPSSSKYPRSSSLPSAKHSGRKTTPNVQQPVSEPMLELRLQELRLLTCARTVPPGSLMFSSSVASRKHSQILFLEGTAMERMNHFSTQQATL
jgi:hypothetical protein